YFCYRSPNSNSKNTSTTPYSYLAQRAIDLSNGVQMKSSRKSSIFGAILLAFLRVHSVHAQSAISLGFNSSGLSSLRYQGTEFLSYGDLRLSEVTFQNPDGTTFKGNINSTVSVDAGQQIQTRSYSWGTISAAYAVSGNRLNLTVTVRNQSSSTLKGIWFEAMGLHFPAAVQEYDGNTPLVNNTLGKPVVQTMTYGSGAMALAVDDPAKPLQIGFPYAFDRPANTTFPLIINTDRIFYYPDSYPLIVRSIPASSTDQYRFSLRFGPAGSTAGSLAGDAYQAFAAAFPATLSWPDRRPIGSLILATAAT